MSSAITRKLSVIMAVHNGQAYLRGAVDSILNQTYRDFDLIITNDGSIDMTAGILEEYALKDERVKVITQERKGLTRSLNRMIDISKGSIIARHDADDLSHPERFERQIERLLKDPKLMLIGTGAYYIDESGKVIGGEEVYAASEIIRRTLPRRNCFFHGSVMVKKYCLETVGKYHEEFKFGQDYDLFLRIAEKYETANIPEALYYHRIHTSNLSSQKAIEQKKAAFIAQKASELRRRLKNERWSCEAYENLERKVRGFYYKKMIESDVYLDKAKVCLMRGEKDKAIKYFGRAVLSFPRPRSIYNFLKVMIREFK